MLLGLLRAARPHQWVKNLFVLLPIVFAGSLLDLGALLRASLAFVAFCFAASAVYVQNDLRDVEADRLHPKKRNRPIASGLVSEAAATRFSYVLAVFGLGIATALAPTVGAVVAGYLVLNIAYTLHLKRVAYLDVLCIAAGFELRVLAGTFAVAAPPSTYLLVATFALASFLGFGKRLHELIEAEEEDLGRQREALLRYGKRWLTALLIVNGIVTFVVYVLYTLDTSTAERFGTDRLVATSLFTGFGLVRFVRLVTHRPEAESPTEEMLRDRWFLVNLLAWAVCVVVVIYLGR